jgi:hypothetical protein
VSALVCCPVSLTIDERDETLLELDDAPSTTLGIEERIESVSLPEYAGPYEVTPSGSSQVLATSGRAMMADVTVNPIPSNYGLITYSGGILTVS